jgi:hypothetical protein
MASQTTHIESNGRSSRGVFGNAAEFVHDLMTLTELQVKLLVLDMKEGSRHAMLPLALILFGGCLALGCFPVLLAALGFGLVAAGLSYWLSFLIAGIVGLAISGGAAYGGFRLLKKQAAVLRRSQAEFDRNVRWVKSALTRKPHPSEYHVPS